MKKSFIKKIILITLTIFCSIIVTACEKVNPEEQRAKVLAVLEEAKNLKTEELALKAIEESKSYRKKTVFRCIGDSDEGPLSFISFLNYLQSLNPSFGVKCDWKTVNMVEMDKELVKQYDKGYNKYSVAFVDSEDLAKKEMEANILRNFVPKDWEKGNRLKVGSYKGIMPFHKVGVDNPYTQYLLITSNTEMPWLSAAYISFISSTYMGYEAWASNTEYNPQNTQIRDELIELHGRTDLQNKIGG